MDIKKNNRKMIIFDLDGTLWDSGQSLAESWGIEVAKEANIDKKFTADMIHGVMGFTMDEIADRLLPEIETPKRYEVFRKCEAYEIEYLAKHGGVLFDGVADTLKLLSDMGYGMSIVSNCQNGYINAFLTSMGLTDYFIDYEEWGHTLLTKSENIKLVMERNDFDKYIYIGDIQNDCNSAHKAGIECISADYGFGEISDAIDSVQSFDEIPACLSRIGF